MFTHKIEYESPSGDTLYCEVQYNVKFGSSGVLHGPPENCYPPEPDELEIVEICPCGNELIFQLERYLKAASPELCQKFWEPIIEWIYLHCEEELIDVARKEVAEPQFEDDL